MPIVQSTSGQILDDVYITETQSPPNIQGVQTGIVKMVGDFTRGIPGAIYTFSDYATAVRNLGPSTLAVNGPLNIQALIKQYAGGLRITPVFGTTATPAKVTLQDTATPTAGNVLTLTAAQVHPQTSLTTAILGSDANSMTATVAINGSAFDLTIYDPRTNTSETYTELTDSSMMATINAKSKIAIASLPSSPSSLLPAAGTFAFSGGTEGTPGDSDFVGSSGTGLTALNAITGNMVFVANQYSTTINAAVAQHGTTYNCMPLTCMAPGSTVAATVTGNVNKQDNMAYCDGWQNIYDQDTKTNRQIAPTALVAGMAAQLPWYKSWGNKTIYGTLGSVTPRSTDDLKTLQAAGVLCVCDSIPRGGIGTRSGVAADGSDLYVRRSRYFLEQSAMTSMGWAVDEMQSSGDNDPLRKDVKGSLDAFSEPLANPPDPKNKQIDSYLVICNSSNNSASSVAAGNLVVNWKVRLLGTAKNIDVFSDISTSTITTSSTVSSS
ncbi:hypothetical protein [Desulfosporosinus sp. FKA]|uniref:hypothetical protein n=1 Tax=Desulfosporosinus sp. FKA TaxID=1969834 RepID=UPI000B4A3987|nr:hypothetical protein [Desulfosporosinus sp. FKA]